MEEPRNHRTSGQVNLVAKLPQPYPTVAKHRPANAKSSDFQWIDRQR